MDARAVMEIYRIYRSRRGKQVPASQSNFDGGIEKFDSATINVHFSATGVSSDYKKPHEIILSILTWGSKKNERPHFQYVNHPNFSLSGIGRGMLR